MQPRLYHPHVPDLFTGALMVWFVFLKTGFPCVALAVPELTVQTRLTLNSESSTCLCIWRDGVNGALHHHQPAHLQFNMPHK